MIQRARLWKELQRMVAQELKEEERDYLGRAFGRELHFWDDAALQENKSRQHSI